MGSKFLLRSVLLGLLTLLGFVSIYQALFCAWMTAYSVANAAAWRGRFYVWLAATAIVSLLWSGLLVSIVRHTRRNGQAT